VIQNTERRGRGGLDSGRSILFALVLVCSTALAGSPTDGNEWFEAAPLPGPRAFHMTTFAATDSGPRLYVVGGQRSPSDTTERLCIEYSPRSNSWVQRAAMRQRRGLGQACAVKGRVYVLGGCRTFGTMLADVEVFNPNANTWTVGPNMPESLYDFGAAVWRDSLTYTLGGGNWLASTPPTGAVWLFDPAHSTWHAATALPEPLGAPVCGIVGDTVLVATGWTDSGPTNKAWMGLIDTTNPAVISWRELDTLPGPRRCRAACGTVNGELYAIGGLTLDSSPPSSFLLHPSSFIPHPFSFSALSDVWSFGADNGRWRQHAAKPHPVSSVCGAGSDSAGHIYVAGGYPGTAPFLQATEYLDMSSYAHDVGITGILSPTGRLVPLDTCPVTALLRNFGATAESFGARIEVLDSASQTPVLEHDTLLELGPDSTRLVRFGSFVPAASAVFHTTASVNLAGDQNPQNDSSRQRSRTTTGSDPDGFGYTYESTQEPDTVAFSWYDTAGGTVIDNWDPNPDEGTSRRRLLFEFPFYGDTSNRIYVCTNGYLQTSNNVAGLNFPLPFEGITDIIAPFWDDLSLRDGGQVYENLTGGRAAYTWVGVARAQPDTGRLTFQVVLDPSGNILFNYLRLTADASSSTIGIQGDDGSWNWYQQYVYNADPLKHVPTDSTSILFRVPGVGIAERLDPGLRSPVLRLPSVCRGPLHITVSTGIRSLRVFNASGSLLRVLLPPSSFLPPPSSLSWDRRDQQGRLVPAGAYFLRAEAPGRSLTRKVVLLD